MQLRKIIVDGIELDLKTNAKFENNPELVKENISQKSLIMFREETKEQVLRFMNKLRFALDVIKENFEQKIENLKGVKLVFQEREHIYSVFFEENGIYFINFKKGSETHLKIRNCARNIYVVYNFGATDGETACKWFKDLKGQSILATFNTYLLSMEITRPDCCFSTYIDEEDNNIKMVSFVKLTNKRIRDASNIEKMYRSGLFN